MRVLGIDPGLRNLGWGVIDVEGSRLAHVANGICHSEGADLAGRLLSLHRQLTEIVARHAPQAAAVEQTFVNKDGAGTLKLGQARGIAMLVPAQFGLTVGNMRPIPSRRPWSVSAMPPRIRSRIWCACNCPESNWRGRMPPMRWRSPSVTPITPASPPRWPGGWAHDRARCGADRLCRGRSRSDRCARRGLPCLLF